MTDYNVRSKSFNKGWRDAILYLQTRVEHVRPTFNNYEQVKGGNTMQQSVLAIIQTEIDAMANLAMPDDVLTTPYDTNVNWYPDW